MVLPYSPEKHVNYLVFLRSVCDEYARYMSVSVSWIYVHINYYSWHIHRFMVP